MQVKFAEGKDKSWKDFIADVSDKYEAERHVNCDYKEFMFYIDDNGKRVGALFGYTSCLEVHIEDLFIDEQYRRKGYGTMLLKSVEEYFKGTKYKNISLYTNGYQAPEFYKKCGYELEYERGYEDPKFNQYFFNKWINK